MQKYLKNNSGFTLVELLVSISIIAIISGLFLANYRGGEKSNQLNLSAQELASNFRLAQNHALGLLDFEDATPYGWGVNIDTQNDYFVVFANLDGNYSFDDNEEYLRINLSKGVGFDSILVDETSSLDLNVVFTPPDPTTHINNSDASEEAVITLKNQSGQTKAVSINFFGLVEVLN